MPAPPRCFYKGARAMTCLETLPPTALRERLLAVLETQRLVLRAPQLGDAKAIAALANDRRIAENTARIPHPYRLPTPRAGSSARRPTRRRDLSHHAREWDRDRWLRLRHARWRGRDRLLARHPVLGQGLRHRSRARPDRSRLHRPRSTRRCSPRCASPTRPRAVCSRSAASSGPASGCAASARSARRCRSTASGSNAASGPRSRAGAR